MEKYWQLTKALPLENNQEVVSDFLLSLKLANRSEGTVIQYRRFLEHFFNDMVDPFSSLSSDTILEWFRTHQSHIKEATLQLRLSILSSFYSFCLKEALVERSPIKSRWFPRLPQPVPKYLDKEEVAKIRQQCELTILRNQLLVEFMLVSGCRVSEVHRLNREDLNFEKRTAKVVGKGTKIRHVHFTDKCAVLLEMYLKTSRKKVSPALLVSNTTGKRLSIRTIQQILKDIGDNTELSLGLHPHRLRHTFATELLAKGAELSFIGDELGHSDLGTTLIYARLPKREIIALYRKYMG
ncbi:tyrosine-type recombinase/integrase [Rossellomorea sp. GCM10028870]|uniref:tyrosine-type recombinase/integrase n=1 Tax=Rossellomorea sp. GCM10028870 TaxID=3273426 RepID=UPI00361D7922